MERQGAGRPKSGEHRQALHRWRNGCCTSYRGWPNEFWSAELLWWMFTFRQFEVTCWGNVHCRINTLAWSQQSRTGKGWALNVWTFEVLTTMHMCIWSHFFFVPPQFFRRCHAVMLYCRNPAHVAQEYVSVVTTILPYVFNVTVTWFNYRDN